MPKVSIVIPVYNAQDFICETLDSVQKQTFIDFECIIVNDGSTDKSLEIIDSYAELDDRFKVFSIPNSGCANIPIHFGVKHCVSDLIMIIGHDDKIDESCLQLQYDRLLLTNSDIVILTFIGCINELKGELYRLPLQSFDKEQILSGREACSLTIGSWQISCNGMLFKKSLYNGIPYGNYMNSDELSSRYVILNSNSVAFSKAKYYYRNHNNSISRSMSMRLFERLFVDKQLEDFVIYNYGIKSYEAQRVRNTRLFNYIYLQYNYIEYKKTFSLDNRKKIVEILSNNFKTINKSLFNEELPLHLKLFLISFPVFKLTTMLYVILKKSMGKQYIFK